MAKIPACRCGHSVFEHVAETGECIHNLTENDESGFVLYCKCMKYRNWQYVQCPVCGKPLPVGHIGVYCFLTPACNGVLVVPKKILQEAGV